jgi:hypothetical protein
MPVSDRMPGHGEPPRHAQALSRQADPERLRGSRCQAATLRPGSMARSGRTVSITVPPALSVARRPPEPGTYGRIADGGRPKSGLNGERAGQWRSTRSGATGCKTVGLAYVGSNPAPATTSENGPLPGASPGAQAVVRCIILGQRWSRCAAAPRWLRTYDGRIRGWRSGAPHRLLEDASPPTGAGRGLCSDAWRHAARELPDAGGAGAGGLGRSASGLRARCSANFAILGIAEECYPVPFYP